jgi:hypothetical protein
VHKIGNFTVKEDPFEIFIVKGLPLWGYDMMLSDRLLPVFK